MLSRTFLASAGERTRRRALCDDVLRPSHPGGGFTGRTWLTTSQSPSMRIAAKCCFTVGTDPGWVRM